MWIKYIISTVLINIIGFILCICILPIVNLYANDANYIPKRKQSRIYKWLRDVLNLLWSKCEIYIEFNIKKSRRRGRRKSNKYSPRRRGSYFCMSAMAMEVNSPSYENTVRFDTDSAPVGIDNRCTGCISHVAQDFVGPLRDSDKTIKGFGGTRTRNVKIGTLAWKWEDDDGKTSKFLIPNSYYVPEGRVRLLSPQHWAQSQRSKRKRTDIHKYGCISQTTYDSITLMWDDRTSKLTVPLSKTSNVSTFHLATGYTKYDNFCIQAQLDDREDVVIPSDDVPMCKEVLVKPEPGVWSKDLHAKFLQGSNANDDEERIKSDPESFDIHWNDAISSNKEDGHKEQDPSLGLLKIHQRFGHISFRKLQWMAKQGVLPKSYATCDIPVCPACAYGKMIKRPWRSKKEKNYDKTDHTSLRPGEKVAVDQLVSPTPGLIAQMTGRLTTKRYRYATVYVDIASRYGYVHLQKSADAEETVQGKFIFEAHMASMGVHVKGYHADNGIFRAHKWVNSCRHKQQSLSFAGVNAHHQNGYAERRIRELQESARAMLIHANRKWPGNISTNLWPYAIRMANGIYNNTPCFQLEENKTPMQYVSNSDVMINQKHYKTFGCPVYVLDNQLQQQKPFSKWKERARIGIYLGQSPQHNRNVALVLSRETGLVSPQFHVLCDNHFTTVKDDKESSNWMVKAGFVAQKQIMDEQRHQNPKVPATITDTSPMRLPEGEKETNVTTQKRKREDKDQDEGQMHAREKKIVEIPPTQKPKTKVTWDQTTTKLIADGQRRSGRLNPSLVPEQKLISLMAEMAECDNMDVPGEIFCAQTLVRESLETQYDDKDPLALKASSDPDTMYMHEAMNEADRAQFITAMQKEVADQMNNGNFTIVTRDQVPDGHDILPAVWQMKRKRNIKTREIKKYKARLNVDGSRMKKGIHYDQTYAPVASWNSIRILLTLAAAKGWHTKQIDYVLAFPQAPVEKEIYMQVPKGFQIGNEDTSKYALRLNRNVYGQKQAGRVWNKFLEEKLIKEVGFKQSEVDECVFYKGHTMYLLYTDDSILAGPCEKEIDTIINQIKKAGLNITEEGDIQDFLGINIVREKNGDVTLSQPHLINQILTDLKMDKDTLKVKDIPCKSSTILTRGDKDKNFDRSFHYRSIIGKLNYLEKGTRSDISYITHQCARFTEAPKERHANAIRWLARYLKGTKDKGFIMRPDTAKGLEVYVDADFSGNWCKEDSLDIDTARSRHGYIIKYLNCPIVWKSQLQGEVALSSSESEYTGLSYALREAIPIMNLLNELKNNGFVDEVAKPRIYCEVFEDNTGALEMAQIHKYRPRTKHLNVKLHHFRKYVNDGSIRLRKIGTEDQQADYLTKPLNYDAFARLRKLVMGW